MAERAKGRLNITLEPDDAALLKRYMDRLEQQYGFRPSAAQVVRSLITKAEESA